MKPGDRLGRYQLTALLGEGGMGQVWAALLHGPAGFRKRVALKLLKDGRTGLDQEARLGGLLRHPNLVEVYALEQLDDGQWVCAMELVSGGSLASRIPLGTRAAVEAVRQVCAGMIHAHEQIGLVHCDLKPENLLIDRGVVKVADLGIARTEGMGTVKNITGTPAYMAPEQWAGKVDRRTDIYALGVVLIELAVGIKKPTPIAVPELMPILERCLALDRDDRYPSMAELDDALAGVEATGRALADILGAASSLPPRTVSSSFDSDASTWILVEEPASIDVAEPDAFVGRTEEQADLVQRLLEPSLVTLTALGGMGKTRLARRVARAWPGGPTRFVDLTEARTLEDIVRNAASALDLSVDQADAGIGEALAAWGEGLLVLDNFEQVAEHASVIETWRAAAPELRVLVTSRQALGLPDEQVVVLEPLPELQAQELMIHRAQAQGRTLEPSADLKALASRLDGIPLALELASARLGMLSPAQVLDRLDTRFRLLRSRTRGLPARQATVLGALDWSWDLLEADERQALAQLSVFAGGVPVEAAEAVLELPGKRWALDVIDALVRRSLVNPRNNRLHLFETVRAYAARKLEDPGPAEIRHGQWFAAWVRENRSEADGPGLKHLVAELDNLIAACRRALARGDAETAYRASRGVVAVVSRRGPIALGLQLATAVAEMPGQTWDRRCRARTDAANLLRLLGRFPEAHEQYLAAHDEGVEHDNEEVVRNTLIGLGATARRLGRPDEARRAYETALPLQRAAGDASGVGTVLNNLGALAYGEGHLDEAARRWGEAAEHARAHRSTEREARALGNLALVLGMKGRLDEADATLDRAIALDEQIEHTGLKTAHLAIRGHMALRRHEWADALAYFVEAQHLARSVGLMELLHNTWLGHATALDRMDRLDQAAERLDALLNESIARAWFRVQAQITRAEVGIRRGESVETFLGQLPELERRLSRPVERATFHLLTGRLYARIGQPDRARTAIEHARQLLVDEGVPLATIADEVRDLEGLIERIGSRARFR